jgi:hypothetical protein
MKQSLNPKVKLRLRTLISSRPRVEAEGGTESAISSELALGRHVRQHPRISQCGRGRRAIWSGPGLYPTGKCCRGRVRFVERKELGDDCRRTACWRQGGPAPFLCRPFGCDEDPEYQRKYYEPLLRQDPRDVETVFRKNVRSCGVDAIVSPIKGYSFECCRNWTQPIDLLFIDANHEYRAVLRDFNNWVPFVKVGGVLWVLLLSMMLGNTTTDPSEWLLRS